MNGPKATPLVKLAAHTIQRDAKRENIPTVCVMRDGEESIWHVYVVRSIPPTEGMRQDTGERKSSQACRFEDRCYGRN